MPSVLRIKNPDGTWYEVTALKGDTGITPNLQVGTVTTGNPGTSAEVTITGTPEEPVLNFKIPKGEPGTGGDGSANIDDTTPSTSTTYSSSKIESKLTALNDANAALIEVSKTEPNAENTELWIHPNADEVQLPQINDSVESEQDTWSSKKIAAEVSNKANEKDLAVVAKSGSYNDLSNKPTIPTVPSALPNPNALTFTGAVNETYDGSAPKSVAIPTVPESLKNPNKLTFTGAVTAEYDGSAPVSVEIPSGSGSAYELPIASPTTLGGVQPAAKTDEMTQAVGVDDAGGLWALPGGGEFKSDIICDITTTEPVVAMSQAVDNKLYRMLFVHVKFQGVAGEMNPDGITSGFRQRFCLKLANGKEISQSIMVSLVSSSNTPVWHVNFEVHFMPDAISIAVARTEQSWNNISAVKENNSPFIYECSYEGLSNIKFSPEGDHNLLMTTGAQMKAWGLY